DSYPQDAALRERHLEARIAALRIHVLDEDQQPREGRGIGASSAAVLEQTAPICQLVEQPAAELLVLRGVVRNHRLTCVGGALWTRMRQPLQPAPLAEPRL